MTDLGIPGVGDATLIASGGSALVYKALSGTGEALAVKVLRGMRGAEVARRFEREQSATERLRGHPHIIRIHHAGITTAGEPYLVMPLIGEGSLADELDDGPFPLPRAIADVTMAASALQFAHDEGVLHRDIKPGNLLRDDDGSVIVTDFGIARVVDAGITSATMGATTPLYAAPELLAENEVSVRSEVYSLGALLYALLNGSAAFSDSGNIWASMHRVRTERPADIAGVPTSVMHLIHQAMAKEPDDRPSTAAEFAALLEAAADADALDDDAPDGDTPEADAPDDGAPTQELMMAEVLDTNDAHAPFPDAIGGRAATPEGSASGPGSADDIVQLGDGPVPAVVPAPITPAPIAPTSGRFPSGPSTPQTEAPPAPAYNRPVPVAHDGERREALSKVLASVIAIALIGGLAWFGVTRLIDAPRSETVIAPPVDNSLPSPDRAPDAEAPDSGSPDSGSPDADPDASAGDEPDSTTVDDITGDDAPNTFVSFSGDHFSALLPEGWSLLSKDVDEGYGFRSSFTSEDMYLNVDTTPAEQRTGSIDIAQSARDIASGISSASPVRTEEVDGLLMHSFTFRNRQGVDSIDIFFEVDGDGYAVVAGSRNDPDGAFRTARLVALSIRSNPDL